MVTYSRNNVTRQAMVNILFSMLINLYSDINFVRSKIGCVHKTITTFIYCNIKLFTFKNGFLRILL